MKLERIAVTNYSRLADFEIDVRDHLILVGPNDVGKSSILRLLNLLLGASMAQLHGELNLGDLRDPDNPLEAEVTFGNFTPEEEALFPDEITIGTGGTARTLIVRLDVDADADGTLEIRRTAPDGGHGRMLSREQLSGLGWRMVSAGARERELGGSRNTTLQGILAAVDLGAEEADLKSLAQDFQQKLAASTSLADLRANLSKQLTRALPSTVAQEDLTFVSGAVAADDVLKDVELHVSRDGTARPIADQSDGTRALFALALYELVSEEANVVAIDEPETHLHPTSQRSLARLFQSGANQKVISTHSSDIVGAFDPESVAAIKPGGVVVQPQVGFLSTQERTVAKWWMRDKLEPLTARTIIAVEGISDRIILEAAAASTGRGLDRAGVSIVETDGAGDMGAILSLFGPNGFDIDLALLIDEDARAATSTKLGVAPGSLEQHRVWISDSDLEAEYVRALGHTAVWSCLANSGLFSTAELGNCETEADGTRTEEHVTAFCRRKKRGYKVRAAIAVADLLDPTSSRAIVSVDALLADVAP